MLSNSYRKIRNKLNLVELWLISTRVNASFSSSSFLRRHADEIAIHLRTSFGGTYNKIGTIQRRLAWPLRKDDTQNREAFHIYSFRPLSLVKWFIIENIHLYFIWIKDVISSPQTKGVYARCCFPEISLCRPWDKLGELKLWFNHKGYIRTPMTGASATLYIFSIIFINYHFLASILKWFPPSI